MIPIGRLTVEISHTDLDAVRAQFEAKRQFSRLRAIRWRAGYLLTVHLLPTDLIFGGVFWGHTNVNIQEGVPSTRITARSSLGLGGMTAFSAFISAAWIADSSMVSLFLVLVGLAYLWGVSAIQRDVRAEVRARIGSTCEARFVESR